MMLCTMWCFVIFFLILTDFYYVLLAIYVYIYIYILIVRNSNGMHAEANGCVSINVWIWFDCYFLENSFVPPLDILRGLPLNLYVSQQSTLTVNRVTCPLFLNLVYGHFVLVTGHHFESGIRSDRSCLFFWDFDFIPNGT